MSLSISGRLLPSDPMTGELFSAFFLHEPADEIPYGIVNICPVVSRPTHESFDPIFRRFEAHCTKTTDGTDGGADAQVLVTLHHEDSLQSYSGRLIGLEYDTTGTGGSPLRPTDEPDRKIWPKFADTLVLCAFARSFRD